MKNVLATVIFCSISVTLQAGSLAIEARVEQGMFGDHRSEDNAARNRYRHPVGTLTFLGLEDGMTVMEISFGPG